MTQFTPATTNIAPANGIERSGKHGKEEGKDWKRGWFTGFVFGSVSSGCTPSCFGILTSAVVREERFGIFLRTMTQRMIMPEKSVETVKHAGSNQLPTQNRVLSLAKSSI